jgi:hypothetical protein
MINKKALGKKWNNKFSERPFRHQLNGEALIYSLAICVRYLVCLMSARNFHMLEEMINELDFYWIIYLMLPEL